MRAFWNAAELLDRTVFLALARADQLLKKKPLQERTDDAVKNVREPQRVITFEP